RVGHAAAESQRGEALIDQTSRHVLADGKALVATPLARFEKGVADIETSRLPELDGEAAVNGRSAGFQREVDTLPLVAGDAEFFPGEGGAVGALQRDDEFAGR